MALAQHCLRVGTDPPALLARTLRRQSFEVISDLDDQMAHTRLKAFERGMDLGREPPQSVASDAWEDDTLDDGEAEER